MSDTTYDVFQHYGTDADRLLFTPAPAAGIQPIYLWFATDTGFLWLYDTSWTQLTGTGGTGDVVGPASAVADRIATFDGVTGKLIKDGGKTIATVLRDAAAAAAAAGYVVGPGSAVDEQIAVYNLTTGKIIKDGGKTIAAVVSDAVAASVAAIVPVDVTTDITGLVPAANLETATRTRAVGVTIDGGGVAITTGIKADISVPYTGVIQSVVMLADQAAGATALVIDIWKDVLANYPPDNGDSITASAPPTISTGNTNSEDTTLTGWSTGKNITAGDTLRFNVDSNSAITRVALVLKVLV